MSAYVTFYVKNKNDLVELESYSRSNPIAQALMKVVPYGKIVLFDEATQIRAFDDIKEKIKFYKNEIKANKFLMTSPNPEIDPIGLLELNKEIKEELKITKKQKDILQFFANMQNNAKYGYGQDDDFVWVGYENPYAHFEDGKIVYDGEEY